MNVFIMRSVLDCFMMVIIISVSSNRLLINNLLISSVHILKGDFLMVVNVKLVAFNSWSARSLYSNLIFIFIHLLWVHYPIFGCFMNCLFLYPANCWVIIHESIIFLIYSTISYYISVFLVIEFFLIYLNVIPYQAMRQLLLLIITQIVIIIILPIFMDFFKSILLMHLIECPCILN